MKLEDNLFLISGNDLAAIESRARQLATELAGENADAFGLDVVRESDEANALDALKQTINSMLSPPFMGGRKTVWLKDFSSFAAEKKGAKQGTVGGALNRLTEIIEKGIPNDICLLMNGPGIDKRKRLYKLCNSSGVVEFCDKPDMRDRNWQEKVAAMIRDKAAEKKLKLSQPVVTYLVGAIGIDTARIENELEKLAAFCGDETDAPELAVVHSLCPAEGETVPWALWDAVGSRNAEQAVKTLAALLHNENNPESAIMGYVLQTASFIRNMLQIKILMYKEKIRNPRAVYDFLQRTGGDTRQDYIDQGIEIIGFHPYRARMLAEQAARFKGQELVAALMALRNACRSCVTSDGTNRATLERTLIEICNK